MKATDTKAKDVETKRKEKRKTLAAELGELTLTRAKLTAQVNRIDARSNQIATEMESLK